jgi:L-malate glycosyltransferase
LAALVENKGFDQLIRAFASLEKIDVELCIGGDGPQRGALEKLCKDLGVCDRVQFLGLLERREVLEQMNLCDAFVLASHYETFGIVYIEALSCGKPVLATSCGGPESIVHQQNGMLVPVGDTHELVKALERMVETIDNYDKQSIRDDCINRFGKQVIAERLSQLYQDVLPSYN